MLLGQQIVGDRRQAVDVGLLANQFTTKGFRGHVLERADEESGPGEPLLRGRVRVPRDPEVQQLGRLGRRVVHDVGGLQVAVDDPGAVRHGERRAQLLDDGRTTSAGASLPERLTNSASGSPSAHSSAR